MNNNVVISGFENAIEKAQQTAVKQVKNQTKAFGSSLKGQVTGGQSSNSPKDQGTNEKGNAQQQKMSDDQAAQFLRDLYGTKTDSKSVNNNSKPQSQPVAQALGVPVKDPKKDLAPEEIAKLEALRNKLHGNYYEELTNPPKPKEEPVAERLEKEKKMEEIAQAKKEEKKPGDLQRAKVGTAETNIGIAG